MKQIISKLGFAVLAFALVFGAATLSSCEKESIEYYIPGTDLTTVEELLDQIKTYLLEEQDAKLQELIDAISGENDSVKAQLAEVIEELKKNNKTDLEMKEILQKILEQLQDWHINPHTFVGPGSHSGGGLTGK